MARRRGGGGKRRGGGRRGAHFMDAAMDGYIRDVALHKWRAFQDLAEAHGGDAERAVAEAGTFPEFAPYHRLWEESWRRHVAPGPSAPGGHLFGRMEAAVREALQAEQAEREMEGDDTIEDTPGYQEFVARAMGQLLEEASGEIEEMD